MGRELAIAKMVRDVVLTGRRAVTPGLLAERFLEIARRIPVRDRDTLVEQFGVSASEALADRLVSAASRASAAVGAAGGTVAAAAELAPPAWAVLPVELAVETAVVCALEVKLVAELHAVYRRPIPAAPGPRAVALVRAWAERRGLGPSDLARPGAISDALGRRARQELLRVVRRRLLRRMGRNLATFVPLLAGAAAGAEVNRRATLALGREVARDLSR